jgi:two-component system nitrogen regulation response regulator GlnG
MSDLLLIDDDPGELVTQVRQAVPAPSRRLDVARTGAKGVTHARAPPPDVVLLNLALPDQFSLAVYRQIRGLDGRVPVIFITRSREAKAAIEAMKQGAYGRLLKPPEPGHLAQVVRERWRSPGVCANYRWPWRAPRARRRADGWSALARPWARLTS